MKKLIVSTLMAVLVLVGTTAVANNVVKPVKKAKTETKVQDKKETAKTAKCTCGKNCTCKKDGKCTCSKDGKCNCKGCKANVKENKTCCKKECAKKDAKCCSKTAKTTKK